MKYIVSFIILLAIATGAFATERQYQKYVNDKVFNGITEYRLDDGTRVDIFVKDKYAIEVDFAHKWYEAIGQASHYSLMTKTPPAVLLILKEEDDWQYFARCSRVCSRMYIIIDNKPIGYNVFYLDDRNGKISATFKEGNNETVD